MRLASTLQKVFPVLQEERGKVLHFALFAALLQAGVTIGMTAADSLFLGHLGASRLPIVYLCMPVVMAAYAPTYSFLLARFGIDRIVPLTLAAVTIGGIAFGILPVFVGEQPAWFLFAGKFYAGMWFIALYTLFWNFTDGYFSVQDGKRLYGILAAGASLGGIVGASLVAWLTRLISPPQLYFAWSICALAAYPVYVRLRRRFKPIETEEHEEGEKATPGQVLRVVFGTFRKSRFALGVTLLCFAGVSMTGMLEYLAMGVLSAERSAAELAGLLGELQAIAQVVTLVINLFLFGRIVGRLGVANTALVLPLAYAAAFLFLHLHAGALAAIAAFYAYQAILPGIDYNNVNLLFNAVPARAKALLRTFVEAMTEPLATAFAGLFLLSLAARLGASNTALVGVFAASAALAVALLTRAQYVEALATNLRRDWLNFADAKRDGVAALSERDRALLRQTAKQGTRGAQRAAADLLWRSRDSEATPALATSADGEWLERVLPLLRNATADEYRLIVRLAARVGEPSAVAALLRAVEHGAAAEVRDLESMLVGLGTPIVPMLIELLRDRRARYLARSVAVRALSRVDVPALLRVADELIQDELKQAEWRVAAARNLTKAPAQEGAAATLVLARTYHDSAAEALDFVLELLSRTGRLPDYDLIRASLAFANAKDRANAIETIQQSCRRDTFKRILRVIEQTAATTPMSDGTAAPISRDLMLEHASLHGDPLEQAAVTVAFKSAVAEPSAIERTERIAALLRCGWFGHSRIRTLDYLAERASRREIPAGVEVYGRGSVLEPVLYVVVTGAVELDRPGKRWTAAAGDVFGERALMCDAIRQERAESRGVELLVLPVPVVIRSIELFPMLGISLYRSKTISAVS